MRTTDKIIMGILAICLVAFSGVFIAAFQNDGAEIANGNSRELLKEITLDEAKAIALDAVQGEIGDFEVEKFKGTTVYEIDVKDGDVKREVMVSLDGKILGIVMEEDTDVELESVSSLGGQITEAQAKEIALREFDGRIVKVEAESEQGRLLFSVEIEDGSEVAEVEIDATTGEVLEVEFEDDD